MNFYKELGFIIIETSTITHIGLDLLKRNIQGHQTIFVGHSGVGKSSLIKAITNNDSVKVGEVSLKSQRGCHTTTSTKYYFWDDSSGIIDTPGIKSLDIPCLPVFELQNYFQEIKEASALCKFSNCLHYKENDEMCYVKQCVKEHKIRSSRYESYLKILKILL